MKAIFINAVDRRIEEIVVPQDHTAKDIATIIGCEWIEYVNNPYAWELYVDEEGLYKPDNGGFYLGSVQLRGNGVILNADSIDEEDLKNRISFYFNAAKGEHFADWLRHEINRMNMLQMFNQDAQKHEGD